MSTSQLVYYNIKTVLNKIKKITNKRQGCCKISCALRAREKKEIGGHPQTPAKGLPPLRTLLLADLPTALPVLVNMLAIIPGKTHNKRKNIYAEV